MIIFDYGHTLCHEADFDGLRGTEAILKYAVKNKDNLGAKEINAFANNLYSGIAGKARESDIEVHNQISSRFMYEYLQIEFSLPPEQIERVFWDNAAPGVAMPGIDKVLNYLKNSGIRTGVISNISFGGANLANRIAEMLPDNTFEFIVASSEYMYRKPNKMLFELALRKADLPAGDVWFCGDSTNFDVAGAKNAGIFPVWYHSYIECSYRNKNLDVRPEYEHLYIREWPEIIEVLEKFCNN
jgi:putative hydrolase of the HAD superfamily